MSQLVISPDGRYLVGGASACHVWDLHDPKPRPRAVPTGEYGNWGLDVQFLNATQLFVSTSEPPGWFRHDIETGVTTDLMRPPAMSWDITRLHPSGKMLKVFLRHHESPNELASYRVLSDGVELLVSDGPQPVVEGLFGFSPTGKHYLTPAGSYSNPARKHHLHDSVTDAIITTFDWPLGGSLTNFESWCFSPDGRHHYFSVARVLTRYDDSRGGPPNVTVTLPHPEFVWSPPLAIHPDGRLLAVVEDGRAVTFRDADTLQVIRSYDFAMPTVTCVAFTPDGTRCVIGNSRGKVLLFDVE